MSRGRRTLGRGPLGVSVATHAAALAILLWVVPALQDEPVFYQVVRIDMVAAPPVPEEQLVVETPQDPEPAPEPEEEEPVVAEEDPEPEPEVDTLPPVEEDPPPAPETPAPAETEEIEDGGDDVNVRLEGLRRDYPAYYQNITNQIERCFRPPDSGSGEVVVRFLILKDGTTSDIDVGRSSGSFAYDLEALSAIECAGRLGRLGPLPEDYQWEVLPVEFTISRKGRSMPQSAQEVDDAC